MTPTLHRWGNVSAIAFAALAVAWFALAAVPDVMDAPEHILDVYADDGVRARVFAGTVLLAFAGAFLLAFLADVCALLRAAGREPLADLALLGGVVFAALLPFSASGFPLVLFVVWIAPIGIALRPRRS